MSMQITKDILEDLIREELEDSLEEKRKRSRKRTKKRKKSKAKKRKSSGKKDACYYKVKSRYSVWPSAYASGALVRCRKVGAKNWGNKSKKNENLQEELFNLDEIISEVIDEVLAEKKNLKTGQTLKDQNEQKVAQTQKASQ